MDYCEYMILRYCACLVRINSESSSSSRSQPFGQSFNKSLHELDFQMNNDALPLQFNLDADASVMTVTWAFKLAFGELWTLCSFAVGFPSL